jgi:two-component system, cell cycle sensor histidine kinase and response regulator CckA
MPQFGDDSGEQVLQGKKVLLAEDQERLRTIIAMMVEELGAEVISVENGQLAVDEYSRDTDGIDLVLMDMKMTPVDGVAAYKEMRQINPNVKVVLSSGMRPDEDLTEVLERNNAGFIEKPFNLALLGEVLASVLRGKHVMAIT